MKFKNTQYEDLTGQIYENDIDVSRLGLISFENTSIEIHSDFNYSNNQLTLLKGNFHGI